MFRIILWIAFILSILMIIGFIQEKDKKTRNKSVVISTIVTLILGFLLLGTGGKSEHKNNSVSNEKSTSKDTSSSFTSKKEAEDTSDPSSSESSVENYSSVSQSSSSSTAPVVSSVPREYKSALNSADTYANDMHMSKAGLYEQLTADAGEKFSPEAAQYAIDNVETDWNKNALESAKSYQEMDMSPESIREQLTSDAGEKFTQEQAEYAVANLPQ